MQDCIRTRLIQANISLSVWCFAAKDTIDIDNIILFRDSLSETPQSRFYGEQPEVTNIRVFGYLAYAELKDPVTKLAERASEGVYLGCSEEKSAYIVHVKASGKMLITPHVIFVEGSFPGIGARRGEPKVNSYIDPLSASEPAEKGITEQAPQDNTVREANVDHSEHAPPASWPGFTWPPPAMEHCDSDNEPDASNDGGADEATDDYAPLTKVGHAIGRRAVIPEPKLCLGNPGVNKTNFNDAQPRAELWAAARLASVRTPITRYTDTLGSVAMAKVRAPGGPSIIIFGAGPRCAGDLVSQLASMSGAPISIVIIDPAVSGASHNLSNKLVVSGLGLLAARHDCRTVIASPPRQSFQLSATSGQPVFRNMHYPDGIMVNGQIQDLSRQESSTLAKCHKIIASANVHDARFVIEGPVLLAQTSPYAQRGHEDHAALWDTSAWHEFVASAGDHHVEFDMCSFDHGHAESAHPIPKRTIDSRATPRRTSTSY